MRPRKLIATAAIVVGLALAVTACSSGGSTNVSTSKSGKGVTTIALGNLSDESPLFKPFADNFVSDAPSFGFKVNRYDNGADPSKSLTNAHIMVVGKPKVIVDWPAGSATASIGASFSQAKIPCIAVVTSIPGCALFDSNHTREGELTAQLDAQEVKSRGWDPSSLYVIMVDEAAGGPNTLINIATFYSEFAKDFPSQFVQRAPSDISFSTTKLGNNAVLVDGNLSLQTSEQVVQRALQAVPAGRHIVLMTNTDDSTQGGLQAIKQAGLESDTIATSIGADTAALQALRTDPAWVGEITYYFQQIWPRYLLAMSKAKLDGVSLPSLTLSPLAMLTKSNVDKLYSGDKPKSLPALPASDAYLKKYIPAP